MNIGNVSSALSAINTSEPSSLMESVGVKMLDKSLDASVSMNDSMVVILTYPSRSYKNLFHNYYIS